MRWKDCILKHVTKHGINLSQTQALTSRQKIKKNTHTLKKKMYIVGITHLSSETLNK